MNTCWENGYVFISGEKSQLAYVQLDSVVAFPGRQTTVNFVEWVTKRKSSSAILFQHAPTRHTTQSTSLRGKKEYR